MAHRLDPHRSLAGLAAAAVALGAAALLAIPLGPHADSRTAVGSVVIDLTPGPVKEWAIQTFGTNDKLFLTVSVLVVIAVIAMVTAQFEDRKLGSIALGLAGVLGGAAVLSRSGARPVDVIPSLVGAAAGIAVLRLLVADRVSRPAPETGADTDPGRRRSLAALGFLAAGTLAGVIGTVLGRAASSAAGDRSAYTPPAPKVPGPPIPPEVQPAGVDLAPFITPTADFYRIDTALSVPQVQRQDWRLRIHGMVDREVSFHFDELAQFEAVDKVVTLTCVSNPVGGNLISNATWTGYRVRDLLARAGVHPDADMVLSKSIDGFTAGTPVEALTDNRDALLAVAMNGEPLPTEHGYPARLVVPGLYGYVSATKWLVDLELTRFDRAEAYWTKLGWSARGPIKTESRIDVPRAGSGVPMGTATFGGVAWAQNRGVRAVEVRIDDGPWRPATLGAAYSNDTWRLWSYTWQADQPGRHTITVRATDGTGALQTSDVADVVPDGATGWHSVSFTVA
ncbi:MULTISPECIES: molybdopterin-dependent oxidoreductase [Mycolicibacterium]|uniref:molybdopterin-dependent oxidoreductase n=1 Tax=Mycolicibacterium TaxID=1866885 RepID=UPI000F9CB4F4|nr:MULTISPECIES: molybdopterin-dependent oxidoreductase [Mycolicibacterium]RUP28945.1 MAG: oxidoreductase [Mycolicibacterium sp.]UCZ58580.1 molybdopterin-dependent oxidoreductase [Mycolicibacterium phocaicum]